MTGTTDMTDEELTTLLELAKSAGRAAGSLVVAMQREATANPDTKSSPVDLVTKADQAAEAQLVANILAARPHDSIFGEEGANHEGTSGVRWILDPIDGTTNYVYGRTDYGVSIGVEIDSQIVVGVVYRPATDTMFSAVTGRGSHRDGELLTSNSPASLEVSLVATGFGYSSTRRSAQAIVLNTLLPTVRDIRRGGSAALDLCSVACGEVDAYYERGLNYWDLAAGWLIAAEAGAIVTGLNTDRPDESFLIASAPTISIPLRALLQSIILPE